MKPRAWNSAMELWVQGCVVAKNVDSIEAKAVIEVGIDAKDDLVRAVIDKVPPGLPDTLGTKACNSVANTEHP
jgi:hypothetical protein